MAIRIITDSTSDIAREKQIELGIEIVPLSVRFGQKEYTDGIDLTNEQFYSMLEQCEQLPTTSQVNPEAFVRVFEKYAQDEIIGIFISSKLSGTYQSAEIAKGMLGGGNIHLIDSKSASFGLAFFVYEAIRLRDTGLGAPQIAGRIRKIVDEIKFYAAVDTLKYLKMGGRLSGSSAFLGTMLDIKPIVSLQDGVIVPLEKKRGKKAAISYLVKKLEEQPADPVCKMIFGNSNAPEYMRQFKEELAKICDLGNTEDVQIGSVVGTHAGPGCVGLAYLPKEQG